jgi:hypothetical protein
MIVTMALLVPQLKEWSVNTLGQQLRYVFLRLSSNHVQRPRGTEHIFNKTCALRL